jgi:hypothetical protein
MPTIETAEVVVVATRVSIQTNQIYLFGFIAG